MTYSFTQLDSVFGDDCEICSVNLKRMWCEFTCSPIKNEFVEPLGYQYAGDDKGYYYAVVNFTVNPFYACTMFNSCKQTSFIAEASI